MPNVHSSRRFGVPSDKRLFDRLRALLGPRGYDLTRLRAGHGRFSAIEEVELWAVAEDHFLQSLDWARRQGAIG